MRYTRPSTMLRKAVYLLPKEGDKKTSKGAKSLSLAGYSFGLKGLQSCLHFDKTRAVHARLGFCCCLIISPFFA